MEEAGAPVSFRYSPTAFAAVKVNHRTPDAAELERVRARGCAPAGLSFGLLVHNGLFVVMQPTSSGL